MENCLEKQNTGLRINQIDILKGLAILLLIIGHCLSGKSTMLTNFLYSFHMPLFFFCSGFLYKKRSIKNVLFKSFFRLIIPCLICFALSFIVLAILSFVNTGYNNQLIEIFSFSGIWYLVALFFISILFSLLDQIETKQKWQKHVIISSVVILLFLFGLLMSYRLELTSFYKYVPLIFIGGGVLLFRYCY